MPLYDYQCSHCSTYFERRVPIDDRDIPLTESCSNCGASGFITRLNITSK